MPDEIRRQSIVDDEHLKLLSLGYIISGASVAFFSLFALMYVVFGAVIGASIARQAAADTKPGDQIPAFLGWLIGGIGLAFFLILAAIAAAKFWTAVCLKKRKSRTFCMVVAAISCLEFPYGTALGVLTFIVLGRESVTRLFEFAAAGYS
jgi:hypothetical protein